MIILDANSLVNWIVTGPDSDDAARITGLLRNAKETGVGIGVPAPAFAEFLVGANAATMDVLAAVERKRAFRVLPFDKRAAHECALLDRVALGDGKKRVAAGQPWQKVKVDRQILAIARVNNASLIVTADRSLTAMAHRLGLEAKTVGDLPIPDEARQYSLLPSTQQASVDDDASSATQP